jgi:hypothetical protein
MQVRDVHTSAHCCPAGDYLGEREDFALKVMHAYVDGLDFSALEFDTAIRTFLQVRACDAWRMCRNIAWRLCGRV